MYSALAPNHNPHSRSLAGAYHQLGVQTQVSAASPHALVAMLFDGFVVALHRARGAIRKGDVEAKCQAIGHAVRIVDEGLKAALNVSEGGKLAKDLSDLYAYICLRLMHANLKSDEAPLDECLSLMQPLREAWAEIGSRMPSTEA